MYYSLEMAVDFEQVVPATGEVTGMLESLVSAWDSEVERARAAEAEVAAAADLEALKVSHRALVETLERSIADLESLQEKTAGLVRLVAEASRPADQPGAGMCLTASGPTEFPPSEETAVIDETNRRDLATLDVRSRWRPGRKRRANARTL